MRPGSRADGQSWVSALKMVFIPRATSVGGAKVIAYFGRGIGRLASFCPAGRRAGTPAPAHPPNRRGPGRAGI